MQEVWRLDNEEDDTLPLMGIINQAAVTSDNHVLLVDFQMAHVLEIAPGCALAGPKEIYQKVFTAALMCLTVKAGSNQRYLLPWLWIVKKTISGC